MTADRGLRLKGRSPKCAPLACCVLRTKCPSPAAQGRPSKLSDREKGQLDKLLFKARLLQFSYGSVDLCAHRISHQGTSSVRYHIGRLMRALGWGARRALERDETAIAIRVKAKWTRIDSASDLKAWLVFDGVRVFGGPVGPAWLGTARRNAHHSSTHSLASQSQRDRCVVSHQNGNAFACTSVCTANPMSTHSAPVTNSAGLFVVVRDRLQAHRAIVVRDSLKAHPHVRRVFSSVLRARVESDRIPAGATSRRIPWVNLAIPNVDELADMTRSHAKSLRHRSDLLKYFVRHSPLSLHLE